MEQLKCHMNILFISLTINLENTTYIYLAMIFTIIYQTGIVEKLKDNTNKDLL